MYDSGKGRWFAPDPAGQYWSPYVGMGNNPVSLVDPDGRAAQIAIAPGIAGFIIGGGLAALDIYSDPNASFSSIRSWARISTAATAGAVLAYCPATWGGFSAAVLGSGAANAADQMIKNGGTENFNYAENLGSMAGGTVGHRVGSGLTKSFSQPGGLGYSYISRSTDIGYTIASERALKTTMERAIIGPSIIVGSGIGELTAKRTGNMLNIMLDQVTVTGSRTNPNTAPATENVYQQVKNKR
jgi:hypothetical protein